MDATRTVPEGYVKAGGLNLTGPLKIWLNVAAIPWGALCAVFFLYLIGLLAPGKLDGEGEVVLTATSADGGKTVLLVILVLVAVAAALVTATGLVLVLHEAIHGLFFWIFTRSRPTFGVTFWYAYASAPGWYLSRGRYLVVGLAPLVLISAGGLALVMVLPSVPAALVTYAIILNAAGAVGDLYMCGRLLVGIPSTAMIEDRKDGIAWHVPAT